MGKIEIFYSYSHKDEDLRQELEKHLRILNRQGLTIEWHDRKIGAGTEWENEIDSHLDSAHIILLLISPDFLASDYCNDVEVKRAMERYDAKEACVIPVILRPVYWKSAPFGKLQALPADSKPVTGPTWHNLDEAFFKVAEGIRKVVEELRVKSLNNPITTKQAEDTLDVGSNKNNFIEVSNPTFPSGTLNAKSEQEPLLLRRKNLVERYERLIGNIAYYEKAYDSTGNARELLELENEIKRQKKALEEVDDELSSIQ